MGKITILWHLQDIDNKRKNLRQKADKSIIRRETEELYFKVEQKQADLRNLIKTLAEIKWDIRRGERENAGNIAQMGELETRLYSGQTTNLKELDQIQKKMIQLERESGELEEQIIAFMLEQEVLERKRNSLVVTIKGLEKEFQKKQLLLEKETREIEGKLTALLTEREEFLGKIEKKWLQLYDEIAQRKQGQAVAAVVGDLCLGCHISLPTYLVSRIVANEQLQTCPSCGRILYYQGK